jgi:hypothetical protein
VNDSQQLREQMWDLVYDLLSQEERQALIARIKSDPTAARLYSEVRLQADLVGSAARVEDTSLLFGAPGVQRPSPMKSPARVAALQPAAKGRQARGAAGMQSWLVGAAAAALAVLLAVGHFWPQPDIRKITSQYVAFDVTGSRSMQAGLTNKVTLRTHRLSTSGEHSKALAPAEAQIVVRSSNGEALFERQVATRETGQETIEIPGSAVTPGARLEVASMQTQSAQLAEPSNKAATQSQVVDAESLVAADLPVREEPQFTYFLLEEPVATPGRPTRVATWNFSTFTAKPVPSDASTQAAQRAAGIAPEQNTPANEKRGVLNGILTSPSPTGSDPLSLAFQTDQGAMRRLRSGATQLAQQQSAQSGGFGTQQAGRAMLRAQSALGGRGPAPAQPSQSLANEPAGQVVAAGEPLDIEVPPDLTQNALAATVMCRGVTVATADFGASDDRSQMPSEAQSVQLGKDVQLGGRRFKVELPPEADGEIEVALFDRSSTPPKLVQQQVFYRQPVRKLQIQLPDLASQFAPGQQVRLTIQVADENGQPAPDALVGVRVWNEELVRQAPEQALLLADVVRAPAAAAEVQSGSSFGDAFAKSGEGKLKEADSDALRARKQNLARAPLTDNIAPPAAAAVELKKAEAAPAEKAKGEPPVAGYAYGLPAGGSGAAAGGVAAGFAEGALPQLITEPLNEVEALSAPAVVELATNRQLVQAQADAAVAAAVNARQAIVRTIGIVVVIGSSLLLVTVLLLGGLRLSSGRVMGPALVVAIASMFAGLAWTGWLPGTRQQEVAMAPSPAKPLDMDSRFARESSTPMTSETPRSDSQTSLEESLRREGDPAEKSRLSELRLGQRAAPSLRDEDASRIAAAGQKEGKDIAAKPAPAAPPAEAAGAAGTLAARPQPAPSLSRSDTPASRGLTLPGVSAGESKTAQAPAALYFNPQLITDNRGQVTIEFAMPPVESQFRLLVDALGQGRIGSRQEVLACRASPSK